jgi:Sel1 repeat
MRAVHLGKTIRMASFRSSNPPGRFPEDLTQGNRTEVASTPSPYSPQISRRVVSQQRSIRRMKIVTAICVILTLTMAVQRYVRLDRAVEPHATTQSLTTAVQRQPDSLNHDALPPKGENSNPQSRAPESLVTATTEEVISVIQKSDQDADLTLTSNQARPRSPTAEYQMGLRFANGEGVTQNYENAMKWFAKASNAGDAKAQWKLGLGYLKGIGVTQDRSQALIWLKRAANNGLPQAQRALSQMYLTGLETPIDYVRAYTWANIASGLEERDSDKVRLQTLRSRMTAIQIADAERRTSIWRDHATGGNQR